MYLEEIKKETSEIFNNVQVFSTIDHPYPAPPMRVISSHKILFELSKREEVLIINWDTINPPKNIHKSSLGIGMGFGLSHKSFWLYSKRDIYPKQKPADINLQEMKKVFLMNLQKKKNLKKNKKEISDYFLFNNFEIICEIYKKEIKESNNGSYFYKNILLSFYRKFGISHDMVSFVDEKLCSLYWDDRFFNWISFILKKTEETIHDIRLLERKKVNKLRLFRSLDNQSIVLNKNNYQELIEGIKRKDILFSSEVFFWAMSICGIKHFGNDRDFFKNISSLEGYKGAYKLQLTKKNRDHKNNLKFSKGKSGKVDTFSNTFLHLSSSERDLEHFLEKELVIEEGIFWECDKNVQINSFWDKAYKIRYSDSYLNSESFFYEVKFIRKYLGNSKYKKILDFACGEGRHSLALAEKGYQKIYCYDWDKDAISSLNRKIKNKKYNIKAIKKNLILPIGKEEYDSGICMYSSIGYFNDCQNEVVIANFLNSIQRGGRIILDLMNKDWALNNSKNQIIKKNILFEDIEYNIEHIRKIKRSPSQEINDITFDKKIDGKYQFYYSLRLYDKKKIISILNRHDFRVHKIFGSFLEEEVSSKNQRMIIVADKK